MARGHNGPFAPNVRLVPAETLERNWWYVGIRDAERWVKVYKRYLTPLDVFIKRLEFIPNPYTRLFWIILLLDADWVLQMPDFAMSIM